MTAIGPDVPTSELVETLRQAQRFGFFGPGSIERAIEHAGAFVDAIGPERHRIVDLGSGGGLPGLVVAEAYPAASVLLIDRREKRTDFLRRAVSRLGWSNTTVRTDDVEVLAREVEARRTAAFDVVTARGFGPPEATLSLACRLLADGGRIVISEPPADVGDRWEVELLDRLGLRSRRHGAVRVFERR
ncbi:MAG: methyltransferase domain-containing protein [Ilumatobacter sp.]|nr:methyltransferase domain-containing protein [Ilumatobacter sp.]